MENNVNANETMENSIESGRGDRLSKNAMSIGILAAVGAFTVIKFAYTKVVKPLCSAVANSFHKDPPRETGESTQEVEG